MGIENLNTSNVVVRRPATDVRIDTSADLNTSNVVVRLYRQSVLALEVSFKYIQCCSSTEQRRKYIREYMDLNTSNVVVRPGRDQSRNDSLSI